MVQNKDSDNTDNRGLASADEKTKERVAKKGGEAPHEKEVYKLQMKKQDNGLLVKAAKHHTKTIKINNNIQINIFLF